MIYYYGGQVVAAVVMCNAYSIMFLTVAIIAILD